MDLPNRYNLLRFYDKARFTMTVAGALAFPPV